MPKNRRPPEPLLVDGKTSVTISFHLAVERAPQQRINARYIIECNQCGMTWDYEPPPSYDVEDHLPLSQLQCPNGCEDDESERR